VLAPFVDAAWLTAHRDEIVLADVRYYLDGRSARAGYDAAHLPGAVYVDLDSVLAAPGSAVAGRHPLPAPEVFAAGMAAAGVSDDSTVIGYDDAGGVIAARLVWMLRALGHDAALLDGGLTAWAGETTTVAAAVVPGAFTPRPWPAQLLASIDDAADRANVVIDARQAQRYAGEPDGIDPRAGHIPGARSLPCRDHLDADGRLRDSAALRALFAQAGVSDAQAPVVSSCGSGVTACHNLLVMEQLGLGRGRLYPGSWSQWSNDPARPLAVGSEPG
jgi:thiosulfate/3-mercaptopyruvate sulfurtransferase